MITSEVIPTQTFQATSMLCCHLSFAECKSSDIYLIGVLIVHLSFFGYNRLASQHREQHNRYTLTSSFAAERLSRLIDNRSSTVRLHPGRPG